MTALRVYENNNRLLRMEITQDDVDGDAQPYNLVDCVVKVYVKRNAKADDPAPLVATVTDAANGVAEVVIDTGAKGTKWIRVDVVDNATARTVTVKAQALVVQDA